MVGIQQARPPAQILADMTWWLRLSTYPDLARAAGCSACPRSTMPDRCRGTEPPPRPPDPGSGAFPGETRESWADCPNPQAPLSSTWRHPWSLCALPVALMSLGRTRSCIMLVVGAGLKTTTLKPDLLPYLLFFVKSTCAASGVPTKRTQRPRRRWRASTMSARRGRTNPFATWLPIRPSTRCGCAVRTRRASRTSKRSSTR